MRTISSFLFLVTALALGMRHALEPDHLVAVSTMVAEERRFWPAARLGLIWGLGHQLPITLLGLLVLVLRLHLPESLEHVTDLGVGLILVMLGMRTFWRLQQERVHVHVHAHDGHEHAHMHAHPMPGRQRQGWLSFGIGLVHGLGGSGPIAVLALAAAPSVLSGVGYLLAFGSGVCVGMFALTLCVVAPTVSGLSRFGAVHKAVRGVAGFASVFLGAFMWYRILPQLLP